MSPCGVVWINEPPATDECRATQNKRGNFEKLLPNWFLCVGNLRFWLLVDVRSNLLSDPDDPLVDVMPLLLADVLGLELCFKLLQLCLECLNLLDAVHFCTSLHFSRYSFSYQDCQKKASSSRRITVFCQQLHELKVGRNRFSTWVGKKRKEMMLNAASVINTEKSSVSRTDSTSRSDLFLSHEL